MGTYVSKLVKKPSVLLSGEVFGVPRGDKNTGVVCRFGVPETPSRLACDNCNLSFILVLLLSVLDTELGLMFLPSLALNVVGCAAWGSAELASLPLLDLCCE